MGSIKRGRDRYLWHGSSCTWSNVVGLKTPSYMVSATMLQNSHTIFILHSAHLFFCCTVSKSFHNCITTYFMTSPLPFCMIFSPCLSSTPQLAMLWLAREAAQTRGLPHPYQCPKWLESMLSCTTVLVLDNRVSRTAQAKSPQSRAAQAVSP